MFFDAIEFLNSVESKASVSEAKGVFCSRYKVRITFRCFERIGSISEDVSGSESCLFTSNFERSARLENFVSLMSC